MKIGFFTDTYLPHVDGVSITVKLWLEKFRKRGEEVFVFYPRGQDYKGEEYEIALPSIKFPFYEGYRIAIPTVSSKIAKGLDIVHLHGLFSMAMYGSYISKKLRIPKIITYHTPADSYIMYITRKKWIADAMIRAYNLWEKYLLESCNIITVPSEPIKEYLLRKGIRNRIVVLSNGIDTAFFRRCDTTGFRRRYGIKKGRTIGYIGRLGFEKHLEDLIGIADGFEGTILIGGRGPAENYYKRLAENKKNIKFLGFIDKMDLPSFYSTIDFFVFPSTVETQGLVALESMACGTPVIGANAMALKSTIVDGVTGYLFEPGNISDLIEKIGMGYENREVLSTNSVKFAEKHSVENTMDALIRIYEEIKKNIEDN